MSRIIVSILSQHSVPNFLFLKEMKGQYDEYLFITTDEVDRQRRGEQLEEALKVKTEVGYISIDANNYLSAMQTLQKEWPERLGDEYIVNLTGGTKMMSLAVHDFFASKKTIFYYVPIGTNTYYNLSTGELHEIKYRVNLHEYFTLYGIKYNSIKEAELKHTETEATALYNDVKQNHFYLPPKLKYAQKAQTPDLKAYYSGQWFEQFSYYCLKRALGLHEDDIAISLKIYRDKNTTNDNELDVAFMYDNALYVIECKVTMWGLEGPKETIEEYLYKLAAISKDFGLQVRPYIFTLHQISKMDKNIRDNLTKRCRILGIRNIASGKSFDNIKSVLKNQINL